MGSERQRILVSAAIVALLVGATVAVYAVDQSGEGRVEAIEGRAVFLTKGCTACHSLQGVSETAQIGPNLTGLSDRAGDRIPGLSAEEYVRQSVLEPQAFIVEEFTGIEMPTLPMTTEELGMLVEFVLNES